MAQNDPSSLSIDLNAVLNQRLGKKARYLPTWFINWLKRLIHQDQLNEMLRINRGKTGVDFSRGVLETLNVSYTVKGSFPLSSRVVIMSNHPLGGLDGMALSCAVADAYGSQGLKFIVNDLLTAITPMNPIFLPVNKHGAQSREEIKAIDEAFSANAPIIMFPAGLVSRKGKKGIADLPWHKMGVKKAILSSRDIVPVWFSGKNRNRFYNLARLRKALGVKFNIEMALLPAEVFASKGNHYDILVGEPVSHAQLQALHSPQEWTTILQHQVYNLSTSLSS